MALKLSTGLRNNMVGASGFSTIFQNGILRLYTGSPPESADDAVVGTLLCTFSAITFGALGTSGTVGKSSTVVSGTVVATGIAGWFRLSDSADVPTAYSVISKRIDGRVGLLTDEQADYIMPDLSVYSGQLLTIQEALFSLAATVL